MRAPSPRSGLITTWESCGDPVADRKLIMETKRGCSVPPAKPPAIAPGSPAPATQGGRLITQRNGGCSGPPATPPAIDPGSPALSTRDGENVWSPNDPDVKT